LRLPAGLTLQLLVAHAQGDDLARAGAVTAGHADELAARGPVALFLADAENQLGPVAHRDVLALPVDVDVAGDPARGDGQVPADAVRAEAEVAQRLELAELDPLADERLRDDRARDEARVLARPVVVEHPRHDAGHTERVVVVH